MHFPPVRASGDPHAGVFSLRKPVNNAASQQAADLFHLPYIAYIMHNPFLHPSRYPKEEDFVPVVTHRPPINTMEGSEFLDDAIRMEDLPLTRSEESVAAGSPEKVL